MEGKCMVNERGEPHGDFSYSRWQLKQPYMSPNQFPYKSGNRSQTSTLLDLRLA